MLFSTILCLAAAAAGVFAAPIADDNFASSSLPKCKKQVVTFNIKVRSLEDPSGNVLISPANGQFLVDVGGPAGFSPTNTTSYTLNSTTTFITENDGSGKIATVKTTVAGTPHQGDIVFVTPDASIANGWSPLRCTGLDSGTLTCAASTRSVLQVCGKFVNMDPTRNANCQDEIAFDVVPLCRT